MARAAVPVAALIDTLLVRRPVTLGVGMQKENRGGVVFFQLGLQPFFIIKHPVLLQRNTPQRSGRQGKRALALL